jgi:hypothetical protein
LNIALIEQRPSISDTKHERRPSNTIPVPVHDLHGRLGQQTIYPDAYFVFKTVTYETQEKIFVNVFSHKKVPDNHILIQDKETVLDKKGENCTAFAVAINEHMKTNSVTHDAYKEWVSSNTCFQ